MRKVTKILFWVLAGTASTVLLVCASLFSPPAQEFAARRAGEILGRKLNAEVGFERASFIPLRSVALKGLYVIDNQGNKIFDADIRVTFDIRKLLRGEVALHKLKISEGDANIPLLISNLKGGRGSFSLDIIEVAAMRLRIDTLLLEDVELRAHKLRAQSGNISLKINRLQLREGGMALQMSCSAAKISGSTLAIDGARLRSGGSTLNFEQLRVDLKTGNTVLRVVDSQLALRDAGRFVPEVKDNITVFNNLNINVEGVPKDLSGRISFDTGRATRFSGAGRWMNGDFSLSIDSLATEGGDMEELAQTFTGRPLADTIRKSLRRLGPLVLRGDISRKAGTLTTKSSIKTAIGIGHITASLSDNSNVDSEVTLYNFNIGRLLGITDMGCASGTIRLRRNAADLSADAYFAKLTYKQRDYQHITAKGKMIGGRAEVRVMSRDRNLAFTLDGQAVLDKEPVVDFAIDVTDADLHALGIDGRDSVSRMKLTARGNLEISKQKGNVKIDNILYISKIDTVNSGVINIVVDGNRLALNSDFAEAVLSSDTTLYRIANPLHAYLPSLGGRAHTGRTELKIRIKNAESPIPGLLIAPGSTLHAVAEDDKIDLAASADYIEHGNKFISNLRIDGHTRGDSLVLAARADELFAVGMLMPELRLGAVAKNGVIDASASFKNTAENRQAHIAAHAELTENATNIILEPSYYRAGEQRWNISAREIVAQQGRVFVNKFAIEGGDQRLSVDGTASSDKRDTLHLSVHNFDISPLSATLNIGHRVDGRASGEAQLIAALSRPALMANIGLRDVYIDDVKVPRLDLRSAWDERESQLQLLIARHDEPAPLFTGVYAPATGRLEGTARLRDIDLSLLDAHYGKSLSGTRGSADLDATLTGTMRNISVNGSLDVRRYSAKVDFLGVRYDAAPTRFVITDNVLRAENIDMTDPQGNQARMTTQIDLRKLNNVDFRIDIRTDNLLVLNTAQQQNELFYGKVYGSGRATIGGNKQGTRMDITAATQAGSQFFMPLSGAGNMSDADFVTFARPAGAPRDSTEYGVRRSMFLARGERNRIASSGRVVTDIALTVAPNTLVELLIDPQTGHRVRGRGNGQLNIHTNPKDNIFSIYGDYRIDAGAYLFTLENIIERPFAIEAGSNIQWTGNPLDALLNITASYQLKTSVSPAMADSGYDTWRMRIPVECRIELRERLSAPSLTFGITAPGATPETQNALSSFLNTQEMTATQFFFLLATGNFYDYSGNSNMANVGAAAGSSTAFDFLSNQLSNWISSDNFNIGIRYRPQTETTSDEWGVDFSQRLWGERLLLEVEGNFDTHNNASAVYTENMRNFSGDFYLTGVIDKRGTLRAKAFTRTITRFDENQGLQESGAGVYFTEEFNNFGDIFKRRRRRSSGAVRSGKPAQQARGNIANVNIEN